MKQIKLLLILCVLILLAACRTTESTNSLNITSESKDVSSGKEFVSSQPILKDNVNLSMSVFKGVTSIFSEDVINSVLSNLVKIKLHSMEWDRKRVDILLQMKNVQLQ